MDVGRVLRIAASAALACTIVAAQNSKPTTGGTTGGTPTGGTTGAPTGGISTNPNRPPTTNFPSTTQPPSPMDGPRPIFLSGKVILNDGSAPPESVLIQRVCNGNPHAEGYTDSKGHFSIQLGENRDMFADASETPGRSGITSNNPMGGGIRESQLMNCELRAQLPGFRSDLVSLATRRYMDNPDVGTIVLHRLGNVEGLTISATSSLAPKDARKAYEKGVEAAKKSKPDDAQKELEKAVGIYPKYASAWFELGKIYEQRDHVDQAKKAYADSITADPKYINPYERVYLMAVKEGKWQDVADTTDRVIRMNPYDFPAAFYYNAVANLQLNKLDAAEKSAREALKLDTARVNPRTNYILGLVLAQKKDFTASAEFLREFLKASPNSKDAERVRKQLSEVEGLAQAKPQPEQ